jgi:acetyl esterase/lipase
MSVETDPYFARLAELFARFQAAAAADSQPAAKPAADFQPTGYTLPDVEVVNETVPGPHGPIPVRVYRTAGSAGLRPLLVWCHGGAWAGGDLDMPEADASAREVAAQAGAVVVSVDYRLANGGVHFPVPLDDVVAAYEWAIGRSEELGVDQGRVTLGGASAGGNLAAGACLRVRDEGGRLPASLLLLYPCLHAPLPEPSDELREKLGSSPAAWPPEVFEVVIENYLGAPIAKASPYALPGLADLRGLPPTLIINCEFDELRASGELFGRQLEAAGVEAEVRTVEGVPHGHINVPELLPQAGQTYAEMASWVANN